MNSLASRPCAVHIVEPTPLKRARSELLYGPACQQGFTSPLGEPPKNKPFFFPNLFYHPPTPGFFVRFGKTKGEIRVGKGDFRGDLGELCGVWTLFGNQPPLPPTHLGKLSKKNGFIFVGSFKRISRFLDEIPLLGHPSDWGGC